MKGTFYEQDLQKVQAGNDDLFRIEKVLKRRKDRLLVQWKGWPDKYHTWIPKNALQRYNMAWSWTSDFYVTVPSTDSLLEFSNNTPSHFKVRLNKPLVFRQSGWKVGLVNITMPPLLDPLAASLGVIPNYHASHQGATDDHRGQAMLMKVSRFLNEPHSEGGKALERYWTSIQGETMDMSNIHDGVSMMKRFVDYVEWKRTKHESRLFVPIRSDYSAGSELFVDDQNNSTRRYTYLKFVWETVAGEEELLVDNSKLHIVGRYKTPQLQFSEAFAKAMQWLSPDGQSLGPNLRIEYLNDTLPNNFTLKDEDLVKNQVFNPVLRTFTGGEGCLWLVQYQYPQLRPSTESDFYGTVPSTDSLLEFSNNTPSHSTESEEE